MSEETTRRNKIDTNDGYDVVTREVPLQSITLEHNSAYGKIKPSIQQKPIPVIYDIPFLLPQQQQQQQQQQ